MDPSGEKDRRRRKMRWGIMEKVRKELWRWKFLGRAFKWRRLNLELTFIDDLLFKIVSLFEAIILLATLCFFFLFCGCRF